MNYSSHTMIKTLYCATSQRKSFVLLYLSLFSLLLLTLSSCAIVDDNPRVQNRYMEGVRIQGTRKDIPALANQYDINRIIYAIPSAETRRQRMDAIGSSLREDILQANITMFKTVGVEPSALENGHVPLEMDVTPFDILVNKIGCRI